MADAAAIVERVIRRKHGLVAIDFRELWRYRELFLFLAWRDILIRYKQTAIGILWAVIQPILIMIVFTVIFEKVAKLDSGNAPYALMTLAGVIPWQFFANAMQFSSQSLVTSANMVRKVYFPRLIVPASATISGVLDFAISLVILFGLMAYYVATSGPTKGYTVTFRPHLALLPVFFVFCFATAFAVGVWLSALNVKYRDVKYVVPFLIRMGLYVSPVGFATAKIPAKWRFLYSLNPMVGVIDGFRWATLGPSYEPYWPGLWASVAVVAVLLVTGVYFFRATERTFADII